MITPRTIISLTVPEWMLQHSGWILLGLGVLLLGGAGVARRRTRILLKRLPFGTSYQDWKAYRKSYRSRWLRPVGSSHSLREAEQLKLMRTAYQQGVAHTFVFLCPSGCGKTWLLYHLAHLLGTSSHRWTMRSFLNDQVLDELSQLSAKDRTWLLLDDLEALSPELQTRERVELILNATKEFRAVMMAVTPERWPASWTKPDAQGRIKLAGEEHFAWATASWVIDWTTAEAQAHLRKTTDSADRSSIDRMIGGIDWRNPYWRRPAILQFLGLGSARTVASRFIYEALADSLRKRIQASGEESWWQKLSDLANGTSSGLTNEIPPSLSPFIAQNKQGHLVFRHRWIQGYFLAHNALEHQGKASIREIRSHPEATYLYLETMWKSFLESSQQMAGTYLTHEGNKVPLRNLSVPLLQSIKYLELPELNQQDFRFLRMLPDLDRIWVMKGSADQSQQIFDHWHPRHGARMLIQISPGRWIGLTRFAVFGAPKKWEEVETYHQFHPGLPAGETIQRKEFSSLSRLFRLDPHNLPNPFCREIAPPISTHQGPQRTYELSMEAGEFGLFDKIYIYQFINQDIHLQYIHSRPHTKLATVLSEILNKWALFVGPDDLGHRELTSTERIDIEQGTWSGRAWTTQFNGLGFQALIQMTGPSHVEIWIRSGPPSPTSGNTEQNLSQQQS